MRLVRANCADTLASVTVTTQQEIRLPAGGNVVILMEVPRTATDFRGFEIQLVEKTRGQMLRLKYSLGMGQESVYGVTTMKVPFGSIATSPGSVYSARITGLQPDKDYSHYRLMFCRPYLARMALQIIGIVNFRRRHAVEHTLGSVVGRLTQAPVLGARRQRSRFGKNVPCLESVTEPRP
jgi:hypothetical protein